MVERLNVVLLFVLFLRVYVMSFQAILSLYMYHLYHHLQVLQHPLSTPISQKQSPSQGC